MQSMLPAGVAELLKWKFVTVVHSLGYNVSVLNQVLGSFLIKLLTAIALKISG